MLISSSSPLTTWDTVAQSPLIPLTIMFGLHSSTTWSHERITRKTTPLVNSLQRQVWAVHPQLKISVSYRLWIICWPVVNVLPLMLSVWNGFSLPLGILVLQHGTWYKVKVKTGRSSLLWSDVIQSSILDPYWIPDVLTMLACLCCLALATHWATPKVAEVGAVNQEEK